jgi:hypothetical protein
MNAAAAAAVAAEFDILRSKALIDMEVIAAGNYSDPRQPAALQLPNNTQVW